MTQEEKELVLTDLCARLRYGVIIAYKEGKNDYHCWTLRTLNAPGISKSDTAPDSDGEIEYTEQAGIGTRTSIRPLHLEKMLPYLRHLSSMTDDEREEFRVVGGVMSHNLQNDSWAISAFTPEAYDWLNAHHFDFRGLIRMGLALEAPNGMYKK